MENKLSLTAKKHTPETSVVSLRIPNDLISKIESIAKQTNRTKSDIIVKCLDFALANIEIKEVGI